ncbi:MAG: sensor histidine kinase [Ardenticatenaceae bacterium]|nr:sensor histidine kinase [Ardenticatenaceae bacterium]
MNHIAWYDLHMQWNKPDMAHIQRIAAWMLVGYHAAVTLMDIVIYKDFLNAPPAFYAGTNGLFALLVLGMSYWDWGRQRLGRAFTPLMILLISAPPILVYHLFLPPLPPGPLSNAEGMTLRQWPVHFIGLILVAWQYDLKAIFIFSLGIAALENFAILVLRPVNHPDTLTALSFIIIIRTLSLLVIGFFIQQLMTLLRVQQDSLHQANLQLRHYASTLEDLTISRERNRLARELHDTLAHTLSGLAVQLETTQAYWDVEPKTARELLAKSLASTRSGLNETRRALKALRASPIDDLGLLLALQKLAQSAAERGKLSLSLSLPEQIPSLAPDVEQCLYRIAQESLENVVYHANAQTLLVQLTISEEIIRLKVEDDGLGFDMKQHQKTGHYGLAGMRERAQAVGGELAINSHPGQGTRIQLTLKGF